MHTLSSLIYAVIVLVLAAPIIEILAKRPRTFLEMTEGSRAFAEAAMPEKDGISLYDTASVVVDVRPCYA